MESFSYSWTELVFWKSLILEEYEISQKDDYQIPKSQRKLYTMKSWEYYVSGLDEQTDSCASKKDRRCLHILLVLSG